MKACLMRVNYDPKYVVPHRNPANLEARLHVTKNIYASSLPDKKLKDSMDHEALKRRLKWSSPPKPTSTDSEPKHHSAPDRYLKMRDQQQRPKETSKSFDQSSPETSPRLVRKSKPSKSKEKESREDSSPNFAAPSSVEKTAKTSEQLSKSPESASSQSQPSKEKLFKPREQVEKQDSQDKRVVKHREGVAKAHYTLHLQPLKPLKSEKATLTFNNTLPAQNQSKGPYAEKPLLRQRNSASSFPLFTGNPRKPLYVPPKTTDGVMRANKIPDNELPPANQRSKTVPIRSNLFKPSNLLQREQKARVQAERAMREKKVFSIKGPYPSLRLALRKRGWVERFLNAPPPGQMVLPSKPPPETDDEDEDAKPKKKTVQPWEEEKGFYNLMSHVARSSTPTFFFAIKPGDVSQSKTGKPNQVVNHFGQSRAFTTKIGLSQNLRSVPWFEKANVDYFYPRCYHLSEAEERDDFADNFRLTACIGFVRHFVEKYDTFGTGDIKSARKSESDEAKVEDEGSNAKSGRQVSVQALEIAMQQCELFLKSKAHEDIDGGLEEERLSSSQWAYFLTQFYAFVQENGQVSPVSETVVNDCKELLGKVKKRWSQYELDGTNNVWILKPGGMSRGRGIQCLNRLDDITKVVDDSDIGMVIQKYIERPFLVYKIKFDIRQWFLVTEMSPLTVWFYKECYLRFCSRDYTLDNLDRAIHLSNNSVQKYFKVDRSTDKLPEDNTWLSDEFDEFLGNNGYGSIWKDKVVPGMKKAIVCSLLCSQEHVEPRKGAFALYGADFMVTEDLQPWLIEINSSPSMARTTHATAKLVDMVLEDVVKVVLDRRYDRNTSTGGFQLIYKQPPVRDQPPIDFSLSVAGKKISTSKSSKREPQAQEKREEK